MARTKPATEELISPRALLHYHDNPVDFVEDFFMAPARILKPGVSLSNQQKVFLDNIAKGNFVSIESGHGSGKALDKRETIMTVNGPKKFGDIQVGDFVISRSGKPTRVTGVYEQGIKQMYKVTFDDESFVNCCIDHLWTVKGRNERRKGLDWSVLSTKEIIAKGVLRKNGTSMAKQFEVPTIEAVEFVEKPISFSAYAIGAWLGDGARNTSLITKNDTWIGDRIRKDGYCVSSYQNRKCLAIWVKGLKTTLRSMGILSCYSYEKFVPDILKNNSISIRHAVLQGLMDTDGEATFSGSASFSSTSLQLAKDVMWLARSLGGKATMQKSIKKPFYTTNGEKKQGRDCYRITIQMPEEYPAFSLDRKKERVKICESRYSSRWISSIEPSHSADCMCITVEDDEHIYLTNDFIPTHNSTSFAFATFWFLFTRDNPVDITKVRLCANSYNQLYDILWPELRRWIAFSPLKKLVTVEARSIYIPKYLKDGTINKESTFVTPVSPSNPDNLQGAHAAHLMWLVDEAFGIQDNLVWETIEGSCTEDDNKLILAGQHTTLSGYVHDTFHKNKRQWVNLRFSSIDSPFVKQDYIDRLKVKYGEDSDVYRIRVLGMEPSGRSDAFIPYDRIQNSIERDIDAKGSVELGVDIARFGDDLTVITGRHGLKIYPQRTISRGDSFRVIHEIFQFIGDLRRWTKFSGTIRIKLDATGGHGSGVIDMLNKDRDHNIEVVPIIYSRGGGDDVYANITSRMWGEIRDCIDTMSLPNDNNLLEELYSRTYKYDNNKIKIQDKQSYKDAHDGLSPDRSDSLCLCLTGITAIDRVFNNYVTTNKMVHGDLRIEWHKLGIYKYQVYVAIKMLGNTAYGSLFLYNCVDDRLFQYDEFVSDNPTPDSIDVAIREKAMCPLKSNTQVHINDIFSDSVAFTGGKDFSYKLMKHGIRVKEAYEYERQGAIVHLNNLMALGKVKINNNCVQTDKQFCEWAILPNGSPERGYSLCDNLLLITSILKQKKEQIKKEAPQTGYQSDRQDLSQRGLQKSNRLANQKTGWEYLAK